MEHTIVKAISIAFLSSTLISGCSSSPLSSEDQALSKLTQSQTEAQDGDVSIPVDSVPQSVLDAVLQAEPGGTIIRAEREREDGVIVFELHVRKQNGTVIEVEADAQGKILEIEPHDNDEGVRGRPGANS